MTITLDDATLASIRATAEDGRITTPSLVVVALIDELRETRRRLEGLQLRYGLHPTQQVPAGPDFR